MRDLPLILVCLWAVFGSVPGLADSTPPAVRADSGPIPAFEGRISSELRPLALQLKARAVTDAEGAFPGVKRYLESAEGRQAANDPLFALPRTELRLEDTDTETVEVTTPAEGSLFDLVRGNAKAGVVYEARLTSATYLVAAEMSPLLNARGSTLRPALLFCSVSKTFTLKGFGPVDTHGGFDGKVIHRETGESYGRGQSLASLTFHHSESVKVDVGQSFEDQRTVCRNFTRKVARKTDLGREISSLVRVDEIPKAACYTDYDCHRDVKLGILKPSVISQCFVDARGTQASCRHRYVDVTGTCSMPDEGVYNFRYYCARGYTCDKRTRRCQKDLNRNDWLRSVGLSDARVAQLDAHFLTIGPGDEGDKSRYCTLLGRLPEGEGWRLPTREELKAVARWFRDFAQENIRSQHKNISAQSWFYPWQANRGVIWSDGPWVYLLSNDSLARFDPKDRDNLDQYRDANTKTLLEHGVGICVR